MTEQIKKGKVPRHVAIIMDGNGRWAEARSLARAQGHVEGVKRVEEIVDVARDMEVGVITLFTFSTENWDRPESEVNLIMNILTTVLEKKLQKLKDDNIQLRTIGRRDRIPKPLMKTLNDVINATKDNTGLIVNLAFNYGSRLEIVDAVVAIAQSIINKSVLPQDIDENMITNALYTRGLPDPDLLIRTSGEQRVSNFLLWQLSYAELYFTEKLWPDFTAEEFKKAVRDFQSRARRYGKLIVKDE